MLFIYFTFILNEVTKLHFIGEKMTTTKQRIKFQLNTLDEIFLNLTYKGLNHAKEKRASLAETYLKLAMRAQLQSIKTMEFLENNQSNVINDEIK